MDPKRDPQSELDEGIRRIHEAIGRVQAAQAPLVAGALARANERLEHAVSRAEARAEKRELRRRRHDEEGLPHGFVFGGAALVMVGFAITQPHLWWLLFPAFGFGMSAARAFSRSSARRLSAAAPPVTAERVPETVPRPAPAAVEAPGVEDPRTAGIAARLARVDDICGKLLAELKAAPRAVGELIHRPEQTVAALRSASHELARRERQLRGAVTDEDEQRLRKERAELSARVASEPDAIVRERLASALESLDAQLAHRVELATAAARIEAEGTRILYSLENLRAQVLRTWSTQTPELAGGGLRSGLEQLSREMDAVATALEEVHATEVTRRPLPARLASSA